MASRRIIFASIGTAVFVAMMAIAEMEVRSSAKWPPPAKHELGAWQVPDPTIWKWAVGLNLPASVPIIWAWQTNDYFTYAIDDHKLIVYLPWAPLVFLLWYAVACHLFKSEGQRFRFLLGAQSFTTLELLYTGISYYRAPTIPLGVAMCFWAWVMATAIGWATLFSKRLEEQKKPNRQSE